MTKNISILGSTGSIGKQTLEIISNFPNDFSICAITTNNNAELIIEQALKFKPNIVVVNNENKYRIVKSALHKTPIKVMTGDDGINQAVSLSKIDTVVAAIVGFAGMQPIIQAIKAKKNIALANKEALVVAGDIVTKLSKEQNVKILPIDSEHSAIAQCLLGEENRFVEKIYLTASGGPFYGKKENFLKYVTPKQALKHPNWKMGKKITIDSATLINKGFEVIEAKWLFDISPAEVEVIIHPQSIIHSLVMFTDGSIKAQMGLPDMRIPILYALTMPQRYKTKFPRFSFTDFPELNFFNPDFLTFRCLKLSYYAIEKGGNLPCILNAANEGTVDAFLKEKIRFTDIPIMIEKCMEKIGFIQNPDLDDLIQTHNETERLLIDMV